MDPLQQLVRILSGLTSVLLLATLCCALLLGVLIYGRNYGFEELLAQEQVEEVIPESIVDPAEASLEVLPEGTGRDLVVTNCTRCHSAKLVAQNRATAEGWESMIRWMQATQNLWDLGENEEAIIQYLAEHFAPEQEGRRAPLAEIEWYSLED